VIRPLSNSSPVLREEEEAHSLDHTVTNRREKLCFPSR